MADRKLLKQSYWLDHCRLLMTVLSRPAPSGAANCKGWRHCRRPPSLFGQGFICVAWRFRF
eukprot:13130840-Heterocapsa_arctica.AAC.1